MRLRLQDEHGGVLVITAVSLLVLVFFVALVVDVGNWKEHKRHLQLQADAAAFAAGGSLALPACDNTLVEQATRDYAGTDATYVALYNNQVASQYDGTGHVPNLHILINSSGIDSPGYYGDPGAGNNTGGFPCATNPPNEFCNGAQGVDIKATETNLPWFFFGKLVPKIHAHARLCLMQQTSTANSLPIAVPNPHPKSAAALFVDYGNSNSLIRAVELIECQNPAPPAAPVCPTSFNLWSSLGTNVPIARQTGVIIAISGQPRASNWWSGSTVASICLQPLTTCFDATNDPSTVGVNFVRGWSNSGSGQQPNPPILREVQLFPQPVSGCTGDYFQVISAACNVTLAAIIDARAANGADSTGVSITVRGAGCPNKGCELAKNVDIPVTPECAAVMASSATGGCWVGSIPIRPKTGAQRLTMEWQITTGTINGRDCTKGQGCSGVFDAGAYVQQAYTGDDLPTHNISGPLQLVEITSCPDASCVSQGNSLPIGAAAPPVSVTIGLKGALRNAQSAADPTASCTFDDGTTYNFACLKVTITNAASGSTQSVDCDPLAQPKKSLEDQLALGCSPQYEINDGTLGPWTPCPPSNQLNDPTHQQPWKCTTLFTGNKTPSVGKGLNRRFFNGNDNPTSCPAYGEPGHNNWGMFDPTDPSGHAGFPEGDPRIVGVYLTAYGAFTRTAGTSVTIPVTDFATFYVTGYDGSPCRAPIVTDHPDDPIPNKGTITGHFIKYIDRLNTGGGTLPCDPASFGNCVPVMTK